MKQSEYQRFLEESRKNQRLVLICGIDDCDETWEGRLEDVLFQRNLHRLNEHPDWEPPKHRRPRKVPVAK